MLTALLSGVLLASPAKANLLTNGSFEAPSGFAQATQGVMPPAWNGTNHTPDLFSTDGSFGLSPTQFNNFTGVTAQHGLGWVAGYSGLSEAFGQQLATMLAPNEPYAFNGYVIQATRPDLDVTGAYDILLNSTNSLAGAVLVATLDPTTNANNWELRSETFTAPANAGSLPWIIFRSYASGPGASYPGLDNASLTAVAPSGVALFDVEAATAVGPPYPAQSIVANLATRLVPNPPPIVPVERLKLSLFDAAQPIPPPITPVPLEVAATAAADGAALDVAFRLMPIPPPILPAESAFDLFFELEAHPDSDVAPVLLPMPPPIVPPNPTHEFDVAFDVIVEGVGTMRHTAHFETRAGQPLVFDNIVVGPPQSPKFHITFDLLTTEGEVMTAEDLFVVTLSAALVDADFNDDGTVNAADYTVWRDGGSPDDTIAGYNLWKANFGRTAGSGLSLDAPVVPEPTTIALLLFGLAGLSNVARDGFRQSATRSS
jgi:hypothetical protein